MPGTEPVAGVGDKPMPLGDPVRLLLAGDVMTGRGIDQVLAQPGDPTLYEDFVKDARDYVRLAEALHGPIGAPVAPAYPWGEALAEMDRRAPHLRIVNLETAVTRSGEPWPAKGIHYRMNPANVGCLQAARIDACTLANNHVLDWGRTGLLDTLQALRQAGLQTAGAGSDGGAAWAPARLPLPPTESGRGQLLLFGLAAPGSGVPNGWAAAPRRAGIALLPDLRPATARQVAEDIARQRRANDLVVVSLHWGPNWGLDVPRAHRDFARQLIDAGAADLVHGHSSHHPLPVELYRGRLILYGCGDLLNDYEGIGAHPDPYAELRGPAGNGLRSDVGCLYFATLQAGSGRLIRLDVVPLQLKRFRLAVADAGVQDWLARVFRANGLGVGRQPLRQRDGSWLLRGGSGG